MAAGALEGDRNPSRNLTPLTNLINITRSIQPTSPRRFYIIIMTAAQGERIQANCKIIWGDGDYDLDVETDYWDMHALLRGTLGQASDHH
ncbi:hypothetical protein DL95DRAFT_472248 [Leptodontidium sp. 2 PMI_412]|nr:hypothetical protein DL95DRAFT_472248 [Leptodontidium sp. 2 PMI_412]